jgi:hypothetical protein
MIMIFRKAFIKHNLPFTLSALEFYIDPLCSQYQCLQLLSGTRTHGRPIFELHLSLWYWEVGKGGVLLSQWSTGRGTRVALLANRWISEAALATMNAPLQSRARSTNNFM